VLGAQRVREEAFAPPSFEQERQPIPVVLETLALVRGLLTLCIDGRRSFFELAEEVQLALERIERRIGIVFMLGEHGSTRDLILEPDDPLRVHRVVDGPSHGNATDDNVFADDTPGSPRPPNFSLSTRPFKHGLQRTSRAAAHAKQSLRVVANEPSNLARREIGSVQTGSPNLVRHIGANGDELHRWHRDDGELRQRQPPFQTAVRQVPRRPPASRRAASCTRRQAADWVCSG